MSRRPPPPASGGPSNAWMATFSDLLMLMLTFFVLLLTMSSLDNRKVKSLTRDGIHMDPNSDKDSAVKFDDVKLSHVSNTISAMQALTHDPADMALQGEVKTKMEDLLKVWGIHASAWVEVRPNGVLVNIDGGLAFEPGSNKLTPEVDKFLKNFAAVVKDDEINVAVDAWVKLILSTPPSMITSADCTPGFWNNEGQGWDEKFRRSQGHPGGAAGYFQHIDAWRRAGDFKELIFSK